jgi:hypothetical protein
MLTLLWFGRDLRLTDNPALAAAIARGGAIVPIFILDDIDAGEWVPGGASGWWLHGSLRTLDDSLRQRGNTLVLRRGSAEIVLNQLLVQTGADAVYWNRRYEPWARARGERLKTALTSRGIEVESFNSALIREPWTVTTQKGEPYRVFTPFWKALKATGVSEPAAAAPKRFQVPRLSLGVNRFHPGRCVPLRQIGPVGCRLCGRPVKPAHKRDSKNLPPARRPTIETRETCPAWPAPRDCRLISISAKSARVRSGVRSRPRPWPAPAIQCRAVSRPISRRSPGGSFPMPCCSISRHCQRRPSARSTPSSLGQRTPKDFRLGSADLPAIRSSMPGCGNCGVQDGCTTACE